MKATGAGEDNYGHVFVEEPVYTFINFHMTYNFQVSFFSRKTSKNDEERKNEKLQTSTGGQNN
jgi:hypothetical protein